jgi:hypothetical protein
MKETTIEDILAKYPDLIEDGLQLLGRQQRAHGRIMDLLFEDIYNRKLIIELKAGAITEDRIGREHRTWCIHPPCPSYFCTGLIAQLPFLMRNLAYPFETDSKILSISIEMG